MQGWCSDRPTSDWSDDEWPEWELLNYVALNAHELATGQEDGLDNALEAQGLHRVCDAFPQGRTMGLRQHRPGAGQGSHDSRLYSADVEGSSLR